MSAATQNAAVDQLASDLNNASLNGDANGATTLNTDVSNAQSEDQDTAGPTPTTALTHKPRLPSTLVNLIHQSPKLCSSSSSPKLALLLPFVSAVMPLPADPSAMPTSTTTLPLMERRLWKNSTIP
ncbi:hypothetical protein EYC84_003307 [Monilinia fructicola]|uniref:Uncharacterized protein n=1 Tax=Monilinia fructicola TaxID=38448 RepID=A0A5M9JVL1_MONFR|nr:hypothetical protein EYC84_003307 [Monilinia fructicola]